MGQHQHDWQQVGTDETDRAVADQLAWDYGGDIESGPPKAYDCECGSSLVSITASVGEAVSAIREGPGGLWRKLILRNGTIYLPGDLLWPEGEPDPQAHHRHNWEDASGTDSSIDAAATLLGSEMPEQLVTVALRLCRDCKVQMLEVANQETAETLRAIRPHPYAIWHKGEGPREHLVAGDPLFPTEAETRGEEPNGHAHEWLPAALEGAAVEAVTRALIGGSPVQNQASATVWRCRCDTELLRVAVPNITADPTEYAAIRKILPGGRKGLWYRAVGMEGYETEGEQLFESIPADTAVAPVEDAEAEGRKDTGQKFFDGQHVKVTATEPWMGVIEGSWWFNGYNQYRVRPDEPVGGSTEPRTCSEGSLTLVQPWPPEKAEHHDCGMAQAHFHDWKVGADIQEGEHDDVVKTLQADIDEGHHSHVYSCACGAILVAMGDEREQAAAIKPTPSGSWYRTRERVDLKGSEMPGDLLFTQLTPASRRKIESAEDPTYELRFALPDKSERRPIMPGQPLRRWEVGPAEWIDTRDEHRIAARLKPLGMEGGYALPNRDEVVVTEECQIVLQPEPGEGEDAEDFTDDPHAITPHNLATVLAVLTAGGPGYEGERGGYHLEPHRKRLREALEELLRMTPEDIQRHAVIVQDPTQEDQVEAATLCGEEAPAVRRIWARLLKSQPNITLWEVAMALVLDGNLRPGRVAELEGDLEKAREARERDAQELEGEMEHMKALRQASVVNALTAEGLGQIVEPLIEAVRNLPHMAYDSQLDADRAQQAVERFDSLMAEVDPTRE